jgi:hypothetical protein
MEMILLLGLCIITGTLIERHHAGMRRMLRARVTDNERRDC